MDRCCEVTTSGRKVQQGSLPFPPPPGEELLTSPLRRIEEHLRNIENTINLKFKELENGIVLNKIVVTRLDKVDQKLEELPKLLVEKVVEEVSQLQPETKDVKAAPKGVAERKTEQSAGKASHGSRHTTGSGGSTSQLLHKTTSATHHDVHTWWDQTFVMNPHSRFAHVWSFSVAMAVLWVCFDVPFQIGFSWWRKRLVRGYFDQALEVFFWIDMLQSFRTGFEHDGHLVMRLKDIAKHYLEMWFWVDLVANFPWELIIGSFVSDKKQRKSFKGLKWLKLSKLLRLARWVKIINEIGGGLGHIVSLFVQVACIILSVHCAACTLMFFQDPCDNYPPGDKVWKYIEDVKEDQVSADPSLGVRCLQSHVFSQYGESVHSAASIVIGASRCLFTYTDVLEDNVSSWLFACLALWQLLGIFLIGKLISHLAKNTLMQNSRESQFWLSQDSAKQELEQYGAYLPGELRKRIKSRFKVHFQKSDYGRLRLLSDNLLPKSLRLEVALALHGHAVREIHLLSNASPGLLSNFCLALRSERYLAGEFVYCCGEMATGLKLVSEGTIQGISVEDYVLWKVERNQIFGLEPIVMELQEPSSWPYQHQNHARSVTQSMIYELPLDDLQALVRQYPDFMEQLVKDGSKP